MPENPVLLPLRGFNELETPARSSKCPHWGHVTLVKQGLWKGV